MGSEWFEKSLDGQDVDIVVYRQCCAELARSGQFAVLLKQWQLELSALRCAACHGQGIVSGDAFSSVACCEICGGSGVDDSKREHARRATECMSAIAPYTWMTCGCKRVSPLAGNVDAVCPDCGGIVRLQHDIPDNPWPNWVKALRCWWFHGWFDWLGAVLASSGCLAAKGSGSRMLVLKDGSEIYPNGKMRRTGHIALPFPEIPHCICLPEEGRCPGNCRRLVSESGKTLYFVTTSKDSEGNLKADLCETCHGTGECPRCRPERNPISDDAKRLEIRAALEK